MEIKTGKVVSRTGLSRQTISKHAALGNIPGARRTPSGRWVFTQSKMLDDLMARVGRATRIRRRKFYLHQDEAEIRRLQHKVAKIRTQATSRGAKRRLRELTAEIQRRRIALGHHLTAREIAKATGRSRRWVTGRARSIPGVRVLQNKFVFAKSDALSNWIHRERRLREVERNIVPGNFRFHRSPTAFVSLDTFRYERGVLRAINQAPFSEWPIEQQRDFVKTFRNMVREVQRATGVTLQ
jgi:DNA-binding transcriptional MerR regulator